MPTRCDDRRTVTRPSDPSRSARSPTAITQVGMQPAQSPARWHAATPKPADRAPSNRAATRSGRWPNPSTRKPPSFATRWRRWVTNALAALEAVLDLSLLERQLVEDGARDAGRRHSFRSPGAEQVAGCGRVAAILDHYAARTRRTVWLRPGGPVPCTRRSHGSRRTSAGRRGAPKMVAFARPVAPPLTICCRKTQMIRRHAPAIVRDAPNDPWPTVPSSTSPDTVLRRRAGDAPGHRLSYADRLYRRTVDGRDRPRWCGRSPRASGTPSSGPSCSSGCAASMPRSHTALATAEQAAQALQDADLGTAEGRTRGASVRPLGGWPP